MRSGVTVREIVLHMDNQASCICCKEIVTVHYKIIWEVGSGYRVSGYLNSCFIWILRAFGAEFVGGFSDWFPLSSYYIYWFLFHVEKQFQNYRPKLLKFTWGFLSVLTCLMVIYTSFWYDGVQHHKSFTGVSTSCIQPASWVVEVVSWKPNDLNVFTLLSSSQMIFLHSTVGNVTIIKSTHDDGCSELSLHICACVMVLFVCFFKQSLALWRVYHSA